MLKKGSLLISLLLLGFVLQAQFYNGSLLTFGKNRVQYQKFNWQYFRAIQYDVYFYPTSKALGEYTYGKAPLFIEEFERKFNFSLSKKINFIVYNTQSDFRESNFGHDDEDFYNRGGITNIYGNKVYLYFDGNHNHFDNMIRSGIAILFARSIIEGESVGANISSEHLNYIPNWFYSGLGSYMAENWSPEIDIQIKKGILSRRFSSLEDLDPVEATYAGHAIWKYIADKHGPAAISKIISYTRSLRSVDKSFLYVTGSSLKELVQEWYRYSVVLYYDDIKKGGKDEHRTPALQRVKKNRVYTQLRLAPDGEQFAFVTNQQGQIKIWIKTADSKKPKLVYKKGKKTEDKPDLSYPIIGWHPNGKILGFTVEKEGRCFFYPYDVSKKKREKPFLIDVEKITDWCFSDDGRYLLFSGFRNGQSDIFLYSFQARSYQNLTQDFYDDYGPRFFNNQQDIIFSSNRPVDSLDPGNRFYHTQNQPKYDLFLYRYAKKDNQLLQITDTPTGSETDIQVLGKNKIIYLGDQNGIKNRYLAQFDSSITKIDTAIHYAYFAKNSPLTDYSHSILEHHYDKHCEQIGDLQSINGLDQIFIEPFELKIRATSPPLTQNMTSSLAKQHYEDSINKLIRQVSIPQKRRGVRQVIYADLNKGADPPKDFNSQNDTLEKKVERIISFPFENPLTRNYYTQFTVNKLITQADFSFLNTSYQQFTGLDIPIYLNSGMNALIMVGIQDILEDYRISAGFRLPFFGMGSEVMLSYEDLSKRLDKQIVYYYQAIGQSVDYQYLKQRTNSIFYNLKYPFDKFNSIRLSLKGREEKFVEGVLSDRALTAPVTTEYWSGVKLEYVYDSSKELFVNLWKGDKLKIFAELDFRVSKESLNLFVVGVDYRKSIKLYKNMTWSTRFAASTNFGTARLVYYMGGVDNWINPTFNSEIYVDRSKNYHYQTLATNIRGFDQNIRNGTSFVVLSSELRIPFIQLLFKKTVSLDFLNTMQLVLFGDIGTAWTGLTPYSADNALYIRYIQSGNITAIITRQVDPWVAGLGLGLRATLFSYFFKVDYAWGIEDMRFISPKGRFVISLGTDF
jgi:hypothetical protein